MASRKKGENALEEIREQASNLDATQMKNEMLLHQTILQGKDAKTMEEDGFSPDGYGDSNSSNRDR